MTVNKLERFAENAELEHVLEYTDYQDNQIAKPKGRWDQIFGNENPVIIELACGTGTYTLELAARFPKNNFIGIDIKGARLWKGAKNAEAENLENVRFLRIFIDHINEYFDRNEVDEIWITFADPYPKSSDQNKRLTSPKFLKMYEKILSPKGPIHFKTDDSDFFDYTCESVEKFGGTIKKRVDKIHKDGPDDELLTIKTVYEKKHLQRGKTISYCRFTLH